MTDAAHHPVAPRTALRLRLRLLANGYEPIPVVAHDALVRLPGKQPNLKDWASVTIDAPLLRSWQLGMQRHNPSTGLRCGSLRVVDIDVLQPDLAAKVDELARSILGLTPLRRLGRAPK